MIPLPEVRMSGREDKSEIRSEASSSSLPVNCHSTWSRRLQTRIKLLNLTWTPSNFFFKASLDEAETIFCLIEAVEGAQTTKVNFVRVPWGRPGPISIFISTSKILKVAIRKMIFSSLTTRICTHCREGWRSRFSMRCRCQKRWWSLRFSEFKRLRKCN